VAPPQPWAASGWQAGPVDVGYRYPAGRVPLYTSFKPKHREGRASAHCHVPCGSGPCLPTEACSDAFTCLTALNPASLLGRALVLPRVTRLQTPPPWLEVLLCYHMPQGSGSHLPARDVSGAITCHMAPDPASLFERASVLPRAPWLRTLPPCLGGGLRGSGAVTCPMTLRGLWALRITKVLAATTCSKTHVFSRHARVVPRCLLDMCGDSVILTCKPCG
jgi:hypothetical protein